MNSLAKVLHGNRSERQGRYSQQGEPPVKVQHETDGGHAHHQRVGRVHDPGADHIPHRVQVVGELRHQIAGTVLGVISRRKPHEVRKQIVAEVVLDVARDSDQDPAHPELENSLGGGNSE